MVYNSLGNVERIYISQETSDGMMTLSQTESAFDLAGNQILTHQYDRKPDVTGTGLPDFTTGEVSATANWLDVAVRSVATSSYGRIATAVPRPETVPTRSDLTQVNNCL